VHRRAFAAGVAAIGSGIAIAMMGITPALAGPNAVAGITTQIVTTNVTVPGADTGQAEAACPAGTLLVGGGYAVTSPASDFRIYVDAPLNGTSWLVEPINFDAQPLNLTAYAVCAESVPGKAGISGYTTDVVQTTVNVPANQTGEADATCPAGQLRTGGGYDVQNISSNWSVYSNSPLNAGAWNVEIDNEVPLTTTIDSYAVCLGKANSKPVTKLAVSAIFASATAAGNSVQTADESCGPKSIMTGGGHVIDSVGQDWNIQASAPVAVNDWQVQVDNLDSFSRVFDSFAVCLSKV
jgi:hypothetical protein